MLELQVAAHPPDVYKAIGDPNSVLTLVPQVLYLQNRLCSPQLPFTHTHTLVQGFSVPLAVLDLAL